MLVPGPDSYIGHLSMQNDHLTRTHLQLKQHALPESHRGFRNACPNTPPQIPTEAVTGVGLIRYCCESLSSVLPLGMSPKRRSKIVEHHWVAATAALMLPTMHDRLYFCALMPCRPLACVTCMYLPNCQG